jgi:hypothetical protein
MVKLVSFRSSAFVCIHATVLLVSRVAFLVLLSWQLQSYASRAYKPAGTHVHQEHTSLSSTNHSTGSKLKSEQPQQNLD